jgi:hypothetical protein
MDWFLGFFVLVLQIYGIVDVVRSGKPPQNKFLWSLFILFLPVVGLLIYFIVGRQDMAMGHR